MALKETINSVTITGVLVSHDLQIKEVDKKDDKGVVIGKEPAIGGDIIIRTADGSEHEVTYFSRKFKKGTSEVSKVFSDLENAMNTLKTLEKVPNEADVVRITSASFNPQDYKGKEGDVKSFVGVKSNFINTLSSQEIEKTPQESKFEIEGVIANISDEIIKDVPTGNVKVTMHVIGYDSTIIPVVTVVPQEIAEPFIAAGFYEGGYAKLIGKLVNSTEVSEVVEKMAFGADNVKTVTKTIIRKEVFGGNPMGSPIEHGIDDVEYEQAKTKRKLHLDKIKNTEAKQTTTTVSNPFASAGTTPSATFNPFSAKK